MKYPCSLSIFQLCFLSLPNRLWVRQKYMLIFFSLCPKYHYTIHTLSFLHKKLYIMNVLLVYMKKRVIQPTSNAKFLQVKFFAIYVYNIYIYIWKILSKSESMPTLCRTALLRAETTLFKEKSRQLQHCRQRHQLFTERQNVFGGLRTITTSRPPSNSREKSLARFPGVTRYQ